MIVGYLGHVCALLALVQGPPAIPAAGDSQAVLRAARGAQTGFERERRMHLPTARDRGGRDTCDARIGRFCYWYDGGDDSTPREPATIERARERLLAALEHAAALLPEDDWIAGQRVRYLLEAHRPAAAAAVARSCVATRWWCEALGGLVLHAAGAFAAAESSFEVALRDMPPPERCRWTDISALLDDESRQAYQRAGCAAREQLAARWWWLATPLLSRPANDRRTEHFARVTLATIEAGSATTYDVSWGDDLRELLIRYGEPVAWAETRPATALQDAVVFGSEATPSFQFGPPQHVFEQPAQARADEWNLSPATARERYAPAYARRFTPLAHQVAVFRRGDSVLVVAAYDLSRDSLFAGRAVRAALAVAGGREGAPPVVVEHEAAARGPDVLLATAPAGPHVASLEVVDAAARHVARARLGCDQRDRAARVAVSDLLLFAAPIPDSLPASLTETLPLVYGSARLPPQDRLGLFWEVYGLDPAGETVAMSLHLTAERRSWLARVAAAVGLGPRRRAVELRWDETPRPQRGVSPRALALDVSGIGPGRYRLELSVTASGAAPVTAIREIELARR
jgi:hypothetical protein